MTCHPAVAVMPSAAARAALAAPSLSAEGLTASEACGFSVIHAASAVTGSGLSALILPTRARRRAGAALVARQRVLECLLPFGPVLAVMPGDRLSPREAPAALRAHSGLLATAFAEMGGRVQYQVLIGWDPAAALCHWRTAPELAVLTVPATPHAIATAAEALRARLGHDFAARVARTADDAIALPLDGPGRLVNLACLLAPTALPTLEAALEAVDQVWPEGLAIRLIGPTPAHSFAALRIERPDPASEAAAAARLGTEPGADAATVRSAFRRTARETHPDAGGDPAGDLACLRDAADLMTRLARARAAGGGARPLLLSLRREPGPDPAGPLRPVAEVAA